MRLVSKAPMLRKVQLLRAFQKLMWPQQVRILDLLSVPQSLSHWKASDDCLPQQVG